jgi:2-hydroxychromene-2-carboxylate isomerase
MVRDVGTALIRERSGADQLRAVVDLTAALWAGDKKLLGKLLLQYGTDSSTSIPPILNSAYAELRKAGHYQGAMLHYGGVWYWGIDRLPYLEAALAAEHGAKPPVVTRRPEDERGPLALSDKPLVCEFWFSFRSPYSYIALEQIEQILAPYGVPLQLKPVPPMITRGMAVPQVKQMYIVHDAKREADRLGVPFGEICDPKGKGVDNCLAVAHWAGQRSQADLLAFAHAAARGIWSEALDVAEYVDLRQIVERAGLPWDEAKAALGDPAAVKAANTSAAEMAVYNLWGVPSFRCGDFIAWGQDRLPLLADRLRRHALANVKPADAP